jgi:hypothetical protein
MISGFAFLKRNIRRILGDLVEFLGDVVDFLGGFSALGTAISRF